MIEIKKVDNRPLNLLERIYVWEIFKGFLVTSRHFFVNLFRPGKIITIQYPEVTRPLEHAAKKRTMHRLKLRADGAPGQYRYESVPHPSTLARLRTQISRSATLRGRGRSR